jgi:ABC-2 type transport system permease protein
MPINDLGYKHWTGDRTFRSHRWWVVTKRGIILLCRRKRFLILMILSSIPFVVRAVLIYLSSSVGRAVSMFNVDAKFFENFFDQQGFFIFIITIYAGAGLISNDLRVNALQIYLSKPISRMDYLMGKMGILIFFLALATLVPAVLLYLLAILFDANLEYFQENYWILGSIVVQSFVIIFTNGFLMLGLSSLGKSSRFAGIAFAAITFFSQILYGIVSLMLHLPQYAWVSLDNNFIRIGNVMFRTESRYPFSAWISFAVLLMLTAGSAWIAYRRIKAVEVIS